MRESIAIIGGGPAGATAAERLARAGAPVTLFEERLGWEKPCGGGLPARALAQYPYLRQAAESHTEVRQAELVAANGSRVALTLREPLAVYSRRVLDGMLVGRAAEAGAEIIEDRIHGFEPAGGGWRLGGRKSEREASFLVLADGARSRLRTRLAPPFTARDFMLTFGYYAPGTHGPLRVQFYEAFEGYAWAFPRPDHLSLGICGKVGEATMPALKAQLEDFIRRFDYTTRLAPVFSHLLPALTVESWANLRLAGPGWALAGDAAGLVDPVTGEGIYFAMRSGELLAESLLAGEPASYPERVWEDFGRRLALGARLAHLFYHEDFWGAPSTTRLVEFAARSASFMRLLEDLIDGRQSYMGLALRLYRTLPRVALEIGWGRVRDELTSGRQ